MQVRIVSCRSFKPSKTLFHSRERDWTFGDDQLCAQLCSENHCKRPIDFGDRFEQLSPFLSFMSLSATLGRRYLSIWKNAEFLQEACWHKSMLMSFVFSWLVNFQKCKTCLIKLLEKRHPSLVVRGVFPGKSTTQSCVRALLHTVEKTEHNKRWPQIV